VVCGTPSAQRETSWGLPAGVLDQSKLPRLLAHLIRVPAQEARRLRQRVPVIEGVCEVRNVRLGPGHT
jgi:hypothetical protein